MPNLFQEESYRKWWTDPKLRAIATQQPKMLFLRFYTGNNDWGSEGNDYTQAADQKDLDDAYVEANRVIAFIRRREKIERMRLTDHTYCLQNWSSKLQ